MRARYEAVYSTMLPRQLASYESLVDALVLVSAYFVRLIPVLVPRSTRVDCRTSAKLETGTPQRYTQFALRKGTEKVKTGVV